MTHDRVPCKLQPAHRATACVSEKRLAGSVDGEKDGSCRCAAPAAPYATRYRRLRHFATLVRNIFDMIFDSQNVPRVAARTATARGALAACQVRQNHYAPHFNRGGC